MAGLTRIVTLDDGYHVWTRRVGDGPIPLLLLHGGPGGTYEQFENFPDELCPAGVTVYFYDQLGSYHSDQPDDPRLWRVERFREAVEQVRRALGLERFFLLGQSWGGLLGIEYALAYPDRLEGLIVSNMTASIPSYVRYINELRERLPAAQVARMKEYEARGAYDAPEYQDLLMELYRRHICRRVPWPEPVNRLFQHLAVPVYEAVQGHNEFVVTGNMAEWDRWQDLATLRVPTLLLVGRHDSMRVEDIEEMTRRIPGARMALCPDGSHLSQWDDPTHYFPPLRDFLTGSRARR
jgi:proline iminopeptidase